MCQHGTGDSTETTENGKKSLNGLVLPPSAYPCVDLHCHLDPAHHLLENTLDTPTNYETGILRLSA